MNPIIPQSGFLDRYQVPIILNQDYDTLLSSEEKYRIGSDEEESEISDVILALKLYRYLVKPLIKRN